jgi:putative RecB family exonuclease
MNTLTTRPRRIPLPVSPNEQARALTGRPHVSFSEIRTYQACPLKWRYQYVERAAPEEISAAMLLGTCVHAMVQRMLEALIASDSLPSIDELMETHRERWNEEAGDIPVQFAKGQDKATTEATARRMIEEFLGSDLACPPGQIVGIEESFTVPLGDDLPNLAGRVDLLSYDDGILTITDFKTARSIPTEEAADDSGEQLILYAQGCQPIARELQAKVQLRFVYISKTKEPKVEAMAVNLDLSRIERSKAVIRQVFKAAQIGLVYPSPSPLNCTGCPFKRRCDKWHCD